MAVDCLLPSGAHKLEHVRATQLLHYKAFSGQTFHIAIDWRRLSSVHIYIGKLEDLSRGMAQNGCSYDLRRPAQARHPRTMGCSKRFQSAAVVYWPEFRRGSHAFRPVTEALSEGTYR